MTRHDLERLDTEAVRGEFSELDRLELPELIELMAHEAERPSRAVLAAATQIAAVVARITPRLAAGGRLIYVGAGSAGRLGVLDASEIRPTFDVADGVVLGVIAGGREALWRAVEGAEDEPEGGALALSEEACSSADSVIGVSASGRTPFVMGALAHARRVGALTVAIVCSRKAALATESDLVVELLVGGEVIAGSTRLNAGTAQKMTLNIISTAVMVGLGRTYGNLMVDLRATNSKLRDRAIRIVRTVTGATAERAEEALSACKWEVKPACVVLVRRVDPSQARTLLNAVGGRLRAVLAPNS